MGLFRMGTGRRFLKSCVLIVLVSGCRAPVEGGEQNNSDLESKLVELIEQETLRDGSFLSGRELQLARGTELGLCSGYTRIVVFEQVGEQLGQLSIYFDQVDTNPRILLYETGPGGCPIELLD